MRKIRSTEMKIIDILPTPKRQPLRAREIFGWVVRGGQAAQLARQAQFVYSG